MPSVARKAFDENFTDIERLLELHTQEGGDAKGRRYRLEVLNKSAIVLITSFWEAYCEDIASEALQHLLDHAPSADALPEHLRKKLAAEIKKAPHELEVWKIAGDGWKKYLSDRMQKLTEERNKKLNTPKSDQIDTLFEETIGLQGISSSWAISKRTNAVAARKKLDDFVTLRGSIAHRGKHNESVKKKDVLDYAALVKALAAKSGGAVNRYVKAATKKPLY